MTDKIKLLEIANKTAASDSNFFACLFVKYSDIENVSEGDIISTLHCSLEDYYKLGLCRVPDVSTSDFLDRLNKISQYSNVSVLELNKITKRVNSVLKFTDSVQNRGSYLMAARDKKKDEEEKQ